jgi:hypothetical protein
MCAASRIIWRCFLRSERATVADEPTETLTFFEWGYLEMRLDT